jgi:hypothetical protein
VPSFRRKPYIVEAYQASESFIIQTLEGPMHVSVGDYVVTGLRGEQWAVKPDIFFDSYEPVND